jgi:hypothetical protein
MSYKFPSFITSSFSTQTQKSKETSGVPEDKGASSVSDPSERRIHQRFVTRMHGEPCFWALIGKEYLVLNDLSLKGFSLPVPSALYPGAQFDFVLQREGVPETVQGRAEVASVFGRKVSFAGCRILQFEGDSEERLQDWLVIHVILSATVRISEKDAAAIVSGRSLV